MARSKYYAQWPSKNPTYLTIAVSVTCHCHTDCSISIQLETYSVSIQISILLLDLVNIWNFWQPRFSGCVGSGLLLSTEKHKQHLFIPLQFSLAVFCWFRPKSREHQQEPPPHAPSHPHTQHHTTPHHITGFPSWIWSFCCQAHC